MKKKFAITFLSLVCAICCVAGLAACNSVVNASSVTLNKTELTLNVGEHEQLTATVLPENVTNNIVYWTSDDDNIAVVDADGTVSARSAGTCTITATVNSVSATCTVTVKKPAQDVYIVDENNTTLVAGDEITLIASIRPEDSTSEVVWSVDKPEVVSVDGGKITALSQGIATVTATADGKSDSVTLTVTEDGLEYVLNEDKLSYKVQSNYAYQGLMNPDDLTEIEVADTFDGKPVTSIGTYAFMSLSITSLKIPASVTDIAVRSVSDAPELTNIEVDENNANYASVDGILYNKSVTECVCVPLGKQGVVTIPETMTKITEQMFYDRVNLTGVVMHDGITEIGEYAFCGCKNLNSIVIPESVTEIGSLAFYGCQNLWEIYNLSHLRIDLGDEEANGGIGKYALNIIYMKNFPSGIDRRDDGYTFYTARDKAYLVQYTGDDTELVLPADYNGNVYEINKYAFYGDTKLTSVTVPNGVTAIGEYAFYNCDSLESITIPDSVTSLGESAFNDCENLTTVVLGNGITAINNSTFYHCENLRSVTIQNSVTKIGAWSFENCSSLAEIHFNGTEAEWNAIFKFESWDINTGDYTVYYADVEIQPDSEV